MARLEIGAGAAAVVIATVCMAVLTWASPAGAGAEEAPAPVTEAIADARPPGPDEIVTGAYINDVQELDFRSHSYAVDLYVWFRWRNESINPSKTLEFMNRYAPSDHVRDNLYEEPKAMPDGSRYAIVRNQGRFSTKFGLESYPFDTQSLKIVFEDTVGSVSQQVYVADKPALTINPAITLPGFRIGKPELVISANRYATNFGDLATPEAEAYSRATLVLPIMRPLTALSVKTFVPILLIIVCASLVLFVRPMFVDGRIGLAITALLTLVALQLTSGSTLPEVDYLMMIDKVYLVSYAFIIATLLRVVATSWSVSVPEGEAEVARVDKAFALLLALAYALSLAGIGWTTLAV